MKKKLLFIFLNLLLLTDVFAYKLETIRELPFNDEIKYYESWPDDDGYNGPGFSRMNIFGDKIFVYDTENRTWYNVTKENYRKAKFQQSSFDYIYLDYTINRCRKHNIEILPRNMPEEQCLWLLEFPQDVHMTWDSIVYQTENYVFAQVGAGSLVSWELKEDGKSEYRNAEETEELLNSGLRQKFGIDMNESGTQIYFGEFIISHPSYPNSRNIRKKQTFKTPGYEQYENVGNFDYIGTTKNGIAILYDCSLYYSDTYQPENPIEIKIAALDPWTREVNVIELDPGCWNPPRNKEGLIPAMSQCIDEDGNIYFTDCNKEKCCYEIKKLSNEWLNQYEFANRRIGRMNANYIALETEPKESAEDAQNNGYNFDHEYLWILEEKSDWLKVRKVDGREGWVNRKYVTLNDEKTEPTVKAEQEVTQPQSEAAKKEAKTKKNTKKSKK